MPETTNLGGENAEEFVNLVALKQAARMVLPMISRFANGQSEPMVIEKNGQPVAALITVEDLLRLREYDQQALDSEECFYFELDQRLHFADTEHTVTDLDAFAKSFGLSDDRKSP
ncbi:hypothetical protein C5142_16630 [Rhodococcus sp. BGS-1C]|jgi:PHD/YefM family antitoxin component YafN of YafNO toxin-antitoxin module|uniref:hypothetical protein n=1 Tax=Rhodococcus sp. BGS-1C TaxID=2100132 RepID=UPI003DA0F81B